MSLYDDLGVAPDATEAQIKAAGRKAQKKAHPDAGGNQEDFQKVTTALSILKDPLKRAKYDATGNVDEMSSEAREDSEAMNMVCQLFMQAMIANHNPAAARMIEHMSQGAQAQWRKLDQQEAEADAALKKLNAFKARLSRKDDGPDIIGQALNQQIQGYTMQKAQIAHQRAVMTKAKDMIKAYVYKFDEVPQSPYGNGLPAFGETLFQRIAREHEGGGWSL